MPSSTADWLEMLPQPLHISDISDENGLGLHSQSVAAAVSVTCESRGMLVCFDCCVTGSMTARTDSVHGMVADLSKLRVLDTVARETLRLHSTAPVGTVR